MKLWTTCENLSLPAVNFRFKQYRKSLPRSRNYAYFIDFVPFFLQTMSDHRLKCLVKGWIVTKTSFHAGFWCLSRIKRSSRLPNQKTFGDVGQLWLPFSDLLMTCGLLSRAANLWSETNFCRDSNPCGLHSRASYYPTNTVCIFSAFDQNWPLK